jgi:hypothetical protein
MTRGRFELPIGESDPTYTLREYTANDTWTKPAGLKELIVCCIGAGGGGGSGRKGANSTPRAGGSGGAGGSVAIQRYFADDLDSSYAITIGSGGSGGASQTLNSTNGNDGADGGNTSFGAVLVAGGGGKGLGGGDIGGVAVSGGTPATSTPKIFPPTLQGSNGGRSAPWGGAPVVEISMADAGGGGAGGGGGIMDTNVVYSAGHGSQVYQRDETLTTAVAVDTNGSDNLAIQVFDGMIGEEVTPTKGIGSSGGGGSASDSGNATAGGNGGSYGTGGGGGGASKDSTGNSGAGGDGANGLCLVVEVY